MLTTTQTSAPMHPLYPKDMNALIELSETLAKSDMVPKTYIGKPGNIVISLLTGLPLGLSPLMALKYITPINGNPTIWGDALLALVQNSRLLEYIVEEGDCKKAMCKLKRKGQLEVIRYFSIEDAKNANLLGKDNWQKYPARMLQLRARAFALRDAFADFLLGLSIREEVEDSSTVEENFNPIDNLKSKLTQNIIAENKEEIVAEVIENVKEENSVAPADYAQELYVEGHQQKMWDEKLLDKMFSKYSVTAFDEMSKVELEKCIKYMEKKLNG